MSKELILVPAIAPTAKVEMLPAAEVIKKSLLDRAEGLIITRDSTVEVRDKAIALAGEFATHLKTVEADREGAGKPFYNTWKAINDLAKAHSEPLATKLRLLSSGIGQVNDRLEKEHLARQQELHRQQQEAERKKQEALDKQAQLELAPPAKGKKAAANQLAADLEAQEAAEAAEAEQSRVNQERLDAAEQRRQELYSGGAQRTKISITVTDIKALYAAQPGCVRMEPDLVQITWLINNRPDLLPIPGVTYVKEAVFSARATK